MSEIQVLFLVLAVVYLWECACWLPRSAFVFTSWFGTRWRARRPAAWFGNQAGGLVLAAPLPPLGHILVSYPSSISFSPEGVAALPPIDRTASRQELPAVVPFESIQRLEAKGKKLLVNGAPFARLASPVGPLQLASRLEHIRAAPPNSREREVKKMFQQAFNTHALKQRWRHFDLSTRTLRTLTNFLFWFLFLFSPVVIWRFGLRLSWPGLVAGLIGLTLSIALAAHSLHKRFYPAATEERFNLFIILLLAPASAIRACDALSRPLLEEFHPLAVARVLSKGEDFRELAARSLRELKYSPAPSAPAANAAALRCAEHSQKLLREIMEDFLTRNGISTDELLAAPEPLDDACLSYCPRCLSQFTRREGSCPDCRTVQLLPLQKHSLSAKASSHPACKSG